jgi:hypothetical protein
MVLAKSENYGESTSGKANRAPDRNNDCVPATEEETGDGNDDDI